MQPIKRLDIVVEAGLEDRIERLIIEAGVDGYTLLREVAGRGQRGTRDADGLTSVFQNVCFIVAAPPDQAVKLSNSVRPVLEEAGGMCLVSDAQWIKH
jgi:hypothetical protein